MTASIKAALVAGALATCLFAVPVAHAQTDEEAAPTVPRGPRQLFLPRAPEPTPGEVPIAVEPEPVVPAEPEPVVGADGIGTMRLGSADPDSFGLLTSDEGGFGVDMWRGTTREMAARLIPLLPDASRSRAMRDLARRLLLSSATAPGGTTAESLLGLRIRKLAAMGELDASAQLAGLSSLRRSDENVARAETDALMLSGDMEGACAATRNSLPLFDSVYWEKMTAMCLALAGETSKAAFSLSLIQELEAEPDLTFTALMNKLLGTPVPGIPAPQAPTALQLSAYRAAAEPLPSVFFDRDRIDLAVAASAVTSVDAEQRLDPAERAARIGALDMNVLRRLYDALELPETALDDPLELGLDPLEAKTRAVYHRAASDARVAAVQAEILAQLLSGARQNGLFPLSARIVADLVAGLPVTPEFAWFAPTATRVFLIDGDRGRADQWLSLWRDEARGEDQKELRDALTRAIPVLVLAGVATEAEARSATLAGWFKIYLGEAEADFVDDGSGLRTPQDTASLLLAALTATGTAPAEAVWGALLRPPFQQAGLAPSGALMLRLAQTAELGNRAETVALSLMALGNAGVSEARADTLAAVIGALGKVGLVEEARTLALESVLAAGL